MQGHRTLHEMHVVIWSAMRSGSTEFARGLAERYNWTYAGEPFNFRPRGVLQSKANPTAFLAELSRGARLVLKVFPGHTRRALPLHCRVVLERSVAARWCSLWHARASNEWTGRTRHNCTMRAPPSFQRAHRAWYGAVRSAPHLYLTFEDVTERRDESLRRVGRYCKF